MSVNHPSLIPEGVILDGSLLDALPLYHKKACALDALCQGIESWWAKAATAQSRVLAEKCIRGVLGAYDAYLAGDADAADAMLEAAWLSGLAICHTRTTAAHAMSYQITQSIGYAHGHACMLTLPQLWQRMLADPDYRGMLTRLAGVMGLSSAEEAPVLLQGMMAASGMLPEVTADDALLDTLVSSVDVGKLGNHPEVLTEGDVRSVYQTALLPLTDDQRRYALSLWEALYAR